MIVRIGDERRTGVSDQGCWSEKESEEICLCLSLKDEWVLAILKAGKDTSGGIKCMNQHTDANCLPVALLSQMAK